MSRADRQLALDAWIAARAGIAHDADQVASFTDWWRERELRAEHRSLPAIEACAEDLREVARPGDLPPDMDALVRAGAAERRRECHVVREWPGPVLDVDGDRRGPNAWIQWKGTEVCADMHCACGHHGHFDGMFLYFYRCPACAAAYALGSTVRMYPVDESAYPVRDAKSSLPDPGDPPASTEHPRMIVERGGRLVSERVTAATLPRLLAALSGRALTIAGVGIGCPRSVDESDESYRERVVRTFAGVDRVDGAIFDVGLAIETLETEDPPPTYSLDPAFNTGGDITEEDA